MLTKLDLHAVLVSLPALKAVSNQLQALMLRGCQMYARNSSHFVTGWDSLVTLQLKHTCTPDWIGAVNMPALQLLDISSFTNVCSRPFCLGAFAAGCPKCEFAAFNPGLCEFTDGGSCHIGPPSCRAFLSLKTACLAWMPSKLRGGPDVWLAAPPCLELPPTVTRLECMSCQPPAVGFDGTERGYFHLHAMLSMAAGCIKAGVPLQELRLHHCATFKDIDDEGYTIEPSGKDHKMFYMPLSATLHGLRSLDLEHSEACKIRTVNEVVAAAPALTSLVLPIVGLPCACDEIIDPIECSGLRSLKLLYKRPSDRLTAKKVSLQLKNVAGLRVQLREISSDQLWEGDQYNFTITKGMHDGIAVPAMAEVDVTFL